MQSKCNFISFLIEQHIFIEISFHKLYTLFRKRLQWSEDMYGISIYLNEDVTEEVKQYIRRMHEIGFKGIFSSIHIPEDDSELYLDRLGQLGSVAKDYEMELVVDVSGDALKNLAIYYKDLTPLIELGVTGIRVDYGVSHEEIKLISEQLDVVLNASTISTEDLNILKELEVDFTSIEAWHNYYPRPETGLDKLEFINMNKWLKEKGITVMAFVPGEGDLRGPLFEGLPTLEDHRYKHSLGSALELRQTTFVDKVYIGDPGLSTYSQIQWEKYLNETVLYFEAVATSNTIEQLKHIEGRHTQRMDAARDVIRSQEARMRQDFIVKPEQMTERTVGSITIDNSDYLRYEGEVQITKTNLPADEKVNVIGYIQSGDYLLLEAMRPGQPFEIQWKRG